MPIKEDPFTVPLDDKISFLLKINEAVLKNKGVFRVQSQMAFDYEWKYLATSEGSYIEQEVWRSAAGFTRVGTRQDVQDAHLHGAAANGRATRSSPAAGCSRTPRGSPPRRSSTPRRRRSPPGLKDLIMTPSHAMLTIHEIIAHPTELDRIIGYEANYAGTSFIKLADVGKLKYGSKLFNVTADRTIAGRHVHGRLRR